MIERHELEAWLGPALDDLTPEQVEQLRQEAVAIAARYPDDDDDREAALSAAVLHLLGELTAEQVDQQRRETVAAERRARVQAIQIGCMLHAEGLSEERAARAVGISRRTLRIALGKAPKG